MDKAVNARPSWAETVAHRRRLARAHEVRTDSGFAEVNAEARPQQGAPLGSLALPV